MGLRGSTKKTCIGYLWPCSVQSYIGFIKCPFLKMGCDSTTAVHRTKQSEIWESETLVTSIMVTFDLVVKAILAVSRCTCLQMGLGTRIWGTIELQCFSGYSVHFSRNVLNSKKSGHRAKWSANLKLAALVTYMYRLWTCSVEVVFRSFGALALNWHVIHKRLVMYVGIWSEFGTRGQ